MTDASAKALAAARQAKARERRRKDHIVLPVELHLPSLFEALLTAGLIDESVEDSNTIALAVAVALERWKDLVTRDAWR
jgi:hypothetical protein